MTRLNRLHLRLKRGIAFLLALIFTIQPVFYLDIGQVASFAAETEGQSTTFAYYDSSNLLKPGASFPFYGKDHNRVGLWPYGLTNVEGSKSAAGFCLEPNKSMRTGTTGTIVTYDLDLDGDNLPLGLSREEAEILWYALSSCGNFAGYQTNVGKMGQGHYILGQCATWAIMSGNWAGLDDFREQMEVLMANLKSPTLAAQTRGALEQFFNQTQEAVSEISVPPFASKYKSQAPVHQMEDNGDGTYSITLKYSDGFDWRQSTLVYDLPEGWTMKKETDGVTFVCSTGNPDIGLVKGHFEEGSGGARYWVKPNTFKIWFPDGWDESSAVEGKQAMITLAGEQQTWEVWLAFGKGGSPTPGSGSGDYEIPYTQYLHEETFKRDYKIELEKQCDETGKTLEDSTFEVIEQFDFSQLDGTNLEEEQFHKNLPTSEGGFENLSVCQSKITTDGNGHFEHSDKKLYDYEKTYCDGHPDPIIHYVESDGEDEDAEEENERLEEEAWAAWQKCVDWCEEHCDFHSIDEGVARDAMEADRDEAWDTFIHLERTYTVREVQARNGYILHDLHNDDIPIEIVTFASSQAEGDGTVTGYYPGNSQRKSTEERNVSYAGEDVPKASIAVKEVPLVQAAAEQEPPVEEVLKEESIEEEVEEKETVEEEAMEEEAAEEEDEEESAEEEDEEETAAEETVEEETVEGETADEVTMEEETAEEQIQEEIVEKETVEENDAEQDAGMLDEETLEIDLIDDITEATGSNAFRKRKAATPSNAATFTVNRPMALSDDDDENGSGGSWQWDGVQQESEVAPIRQSSYPSDHTGYSYLVKDHRTEGELHINKRDMELYAKDGEDSYGKSQADATLEGAVYGLYAAEDIVHPDGKTGIVFKKGELVSIASTDQNGDASFVVITEVSETSKEVPNLYSENVEKNGNGWIGRPLILGNYYVEELSRSEGYELSRTGKNLSESNRTGKPVVLTESGSAHTDGFYHRINEWEENSYDFDVEYYNTKGFDIYLSGLPENATVYEVTETQSTVTEQVVTGSSRVEKKDAFGNIIYQTAEGGEYKLDADGNKIGKTDETGAVISSNQPFLQTVTAVNRLNGYVSAIEREAPSDWDLEEAEEIDVDYILWETSAALSMSGYKNGLSDAPWVLLKLSGDTNGERIEEILSYCASDSFWDAYDVEDIVERDGIYYAKIRYAYKGIVNKNAVFDKNTGRLVVRSEYEGGYYYAVYDADQYERDGYRFTVEKKELDGEALSKGEIRLKTVFFPLYETYASGEYLLDAAGERIPVMETVPQYSTEEILNIEETLSEVKVTYDREKYRSVVHVDTSREEFGQENLKRTFRVVVNGSITQYLTAAVSAAAKKPALDEGSYIRYADLLYPGQYEIYEDDGTREQPVLVMERVIKQAIKVTKDVALDSYEHNTYEIHRDPFTVLFGGYNGRQETKTLPGFSFKLYLRSDLLNTGKLTRKEDGAYDYEAFFRDYPEFADSLALNWDLGTYDADGDLKTVHANRGGGKDDYWGQSRMMPYGVYVLVEQQPTAIPQKHYAIDAPQEVEIPFIPQVDADGTVHDKIPSKEYLYDSEMTPEELTARYQIRFNEETHVIYAHNHDGDFEVFKYGLEPDIQKDCQNETVSRYYHYGSISEDAGSVDGVYYETYYDRNGTLVDYGVTKDSVDTMTGKSTAVDRVFAKALIPWSVLDPRYGEVINDEGDIGNRDSGLEADGRFNFVAFSNKDFENEFYSSRLRIEKLDSETGENILQDGASFKIYAAKRDISGDGAASVTGSGDILFDADGIPLYDENEQIFMQDDSGAEVGVFKAYSTVRDGEVEAPDGSLRTEKQCVGYIETYQPLGAGAYVLVEIKAPEGYVKSKPIAFTVYSDKVEYYEEGDKEKKVQAVKCQYVRPVGSDGKTVVEDLHQIVVKDAPTHIEIHKVEDRTESITYRVEGDEAQLKARGDVVLQYKPNGEFAGFGYVTRMLKGKAGGDTYVENATLTLYEGLKVTKTGAHEYDGVKVKRNLFDSVVRIQATNTGVDTDIRKTGTDSTKKDVWDITSEKKPEVDLWYFDLEYDPTEYDAATGILYGLDDWGNRICMLDSETGMAYVTDQDGEIIVWPLDENGDKIISQSVEVYTDENGNPAINMDLQPITDENGLTVYYKDGGVTWIENEWVTSKEEAGYEIARLRQGAYILEETAAPLADGYVQSMAVGLTVKDTAETQPFYMEDDYTKLEISKLDMTSREEIAGATLTLYEAYRVYDDSERGWHLEILLDRDGEPLIAESWVSEGERPHWIDHIMPGDYILREMRAPTLGGYVTASDVEVVVLETGEVQGFVMEDDHTAVEVLKLDAKTGKPMDYNHRATLALYEAVLNENGEPVTDEAGTVCYDKSKKVYEWQTDDGSEVVKTAHQVTIEGGHSYTAYEYDRKAVPGTEQAIAYVTETGAMRFEYLPIGKYVLVEEKAPTGYLIADPVYVPILDVGAKKRVQQFVMEDEPIKVLLTKVNVAGGKEIAGATVAIYRAAEDGTLVKHQMRDEDGNLLYVTDLDGNHLRDENGELIPAMEYDENYLVDRWISGSGGRYTEKDAKNNQIPDGYEVGDLRPHELESPAQGFYYFVEQQTPFGYVRAAELPFEITDTMEVQRIELVNELIYGQLSIRKTDAKDPEKSLAGAQFKFTNLDTNVTTILITGEDGTVLSSRVPVGSIGTDGAVSLYHFRVQEVKAPEGYLLDPEVYAFQFNLNTDRYHTLTYLHEAKDQPNKVVISKKKLTDKEELPGASLEVRTVIETVDETGTLVKKEGELVESWISTDTPHEIEYLKPGEYVLIETRAPEGYLEAERVYFTVKENMTAEEIPLVEMFDDDTKTEILKVDGETKEPLSGVRLKLVSERTGETVKEWITDENGSMQFMGLPAGDYLVLEAEPKEGYQLLPEPFRLTITKDYKLQTFVLNNQKIEIAVEKRDEETREFVPGAVLELLDESGAVLAEWTTESRAETIKGLKAGIYFVKEKEAAPGYLLKAEPMEITVTNQAGVQTFTMTNQKLEVDILKKDKESGGMLPGATLTLLRNEDQSLIREWVSKETPEVFKGLIPGRYTLTETAAPEGYVSGKSLTFEVTGTEEKQEVVLENEKITAEFVKTDGMTGEALEGALLQLIRDAGTREETVIKEWVSGKEPLSVTGIPAGDYIIRERNAPVGYALMKDLEIKILPDQAVQRFSVKNQPIQVEIEKTNGDTGKLLGGATLQLVRNRDGQLIREWISKEDAAEAFEKLEAGRYTVREVKAPSGYQKMEPQEIEVKETEGIQEFTMKNYKIRHSGGGGGGGGDKPKPAGDYMELYKADGVTGERLSGVKITVYRPDGSVYYEGVTGSSGTVRFKKPENGTYTFKETTGIDGYYKNEAEYQFTVKADGTVEGDDTIPNYKKATVMISKEDVTTSEEIPGAEIEITDKDGNIIFTGISDENGKVYFEAPEPGEYHFRETVAPDGYEINETIFTFTVFEDGTILGDCTITDQKHYGTITASYETSRKRDGDVTFGELFHAPKTGDTSGLAGLFVAWLASIVSLFAFLLWKRKGMKGPKNGGPTDGSLPDRKRKGKSLKKLLQKAGVRSGLYVLFLAGLFVVGNPMETRAAGQDTALENIYEERYYSTDNPDSDEAEKLFEKEMERDGETYRLSEIRTEVVSESKDASAGKLEIATSPFLEDRAEKNLPEETIVKDGVTYHLKEKRLEKSTIPAHEQPIQEVYFYQAVEAKDKLPSKIPVTVTDETTGQSLEGTATVTGQESGGERWEDGFSFPVTFHEYGIDGYWLGECVFSLQEDIPDFSGYETELLALIGAEETDYQVEAADWNGEAYEDETGILCRDATVTGKKRVRDCTVTYEGTAVFKEEPGVRYVAVYEPEGGVSGEQKKYSMKAVGVYVPKKGNGAALAVALGLAGAGAGTAGGVYYRKKKKGAAVFGEKETSGTQNSTSSSR